MSIHKTIRDGRLRLGLTETQFATKAGVSRGAVQQWEKGKTAPSRKHQPTVAALISVSVAELMGSGLPGLPPNYRQKKIDRVIQAMENMSDWQLEQTVKIIDTLALPPPSDPKQR